MLLDHRAAGWHGSGAEAPAGLDINLRAVGSGLTPLHAAAIGGHRETAALLLNRGAVRPCALCPRPYALLHLRSGAGLVSKLRGRAGSEPD